MKKIFCDICEVQIDGGCQIIEETTVSNNTRFGVQIIITDGDFSGQVNKATDADLCRKCVWTLTDRVNPYGKAGEAAKA
jgi:hypothetical protein